VTTTGVGIPSMAQATAGFVKEGFKQVFKFDNPNVDSTCGCGESFNIKQSVKA
jgi:Fe-S cluster assembly iron-binding protein IscA